MKNIYVTLLVIILGTLMMSSCAPENNVPHRRTTYRTAHYYRHSTPSRFNLRYENRPHRTIRYRYRAYSSYNRHSYHTPLLNADKQSRYAK